MSEHLPLIGLCCVSSLLLLSVCSCRAMSVSTDDAPGVCMCVSWPIGTLPFARYYLVWIFGPSLAHSLISFSLFLQFHRFISASPSFSLSPAELIEKGANTSDSELQEALSGAVLEGRRYY